VQQRNLNIGAGHRPVFKFKAQIKQK